MESPIRNRCAGEPHHERFAQIAIPVQGKLLSVAKKVLKCDGLAWDAVQDALISMWALDSLPENPQAWLVQAVYLRSLQIGRSGRRRAYYESIAGRRLLDRPRWNDPARLAELEELREQIDNCMAGMVESHRTVLLLAMIDSLDYISISERLDIPVGTVRSRLSRARETLRTKLKNSG